MCVVYNLLPNLCMKPQLTMLTLLIEGLRQPRKDIDINLQPLLRSCKSYDIKGWGHLMHIVVQILICMLFYYEQFIIF